MSTSPRVLLLTGRDAVDPQEAASALGPAFLRGGWNPECACIDRLRMVAGEAVIPLAFGQPHRVSDFDLVWVLGFGRGQGFLDKMQMLASLEGAVRFVNAPGALMRLHAKFPPHDEGLPQPESHAGPDAAELAEIARERGGRWVAKPTAGSFGRNVVIADAGSAQLEIALASITAAGGWALLQRWIPEAQDDEHRVLVAGGRIVGAYRREHPKNRPGNLAAGGTPRLAVPDPAREALAMRAAHWYANQRVHWIGLDLAGPWLLEANLVNPGGIHTLMELGVPNPSDAIVDAITSRVSRL